MTSTPIKGSTIADVRTALVATLGARVGLGNVNVSYEPPKRASDVKTDAGDFEAIWLEPVPPSTDTDDVIILKSLPLEVDETYVVTVAIQVLRPMSDATLAATEARAVELLGEVLGSLATDPNLGLNPANYLRCEVLPNRWEFTSGHLPNPPGFGARFDLHLQVEARLALS